MPQYAPVTNLSTLSGANGFRIPGVADVAFLGYAASGAGDFNGDGYADILIGAVEVSYPGRTRAGASYIIFGHEGGWSGVFDLASLNGANGLRFEGIATSDFTGQSLSAGDINGDGFDDILIGSRADPGGDHNAGSTYVVFGAASGWPASFVLSSLDGHNGFRLDGVNAEDFAGDAVSAGGDINGDGYGDLLVGAYGADPNGASLAGQTYVVFGGPTWSASLDLATLTGANGFRIDGLGAEDYNGYEISNKGDVNGDGFDDIIIGAWNADDAKAGQTYVIFGAASGWSATFNLATLDGSNGFRIDGANADDVSGSPIAFAGDVNADGFGDLLIGATGANADTGAVYVVFGAASGWGASINLTAIDGSNGFRIDGIAAHDLAGYSLGAAGDVNGDGFADIMLSSPLANLSAGAVYVVFGAADGWGATFSLAALNGDNGFRLDGTPSPQQDQIGEAIAALGDVNGDGIDDIVVTSIWANGDDGEAYVVFGARPGEAVTRTGTAIDNRIFGGAFADTLSGLGGDDRLDGGAGADIAGYGVASSSATWVRNGDGTISVHAGAEGNDTLLGVEVLSFTDRDVYLFGPERSFSGDNTSDILFRRTDGIMASWEVAGTTINSAHFLPTAGAEWSVLGTGDIGGDGRDDVIWQRNDGLVYSWTMNASGFAGAVAHTGIGNTWSFLGVGDFNGDLTDDLAWQRNDGLVYIWNMHASAIQSANAVTGLAAEWQLQGLGDFNGDGRDDFLWRNANTGQTVIWHMNGGAITSSGATSQEADAAWSVVGVGDTNGDWRDDIILQRASDGMVAVWAMNGLSVTSATNIAAANPNDWTIQGIGDYNGDGRDDILWQHDNGLVYVWLLNGATIAGAGGLSGVGAEWSII